MNEQSTQIYLDLIEQLARCTSEAEFQKCIKDNKELINQKFYQLIKQLAKTSDHNGQPEAINLFATHFAERFKILEDEKQKSLQAKSKEYINFLIQALKIVGKSNNNPKLVYSFLKTNLDKLDETFVDYFYRWVISTISTLESQEAYELAVLVGNFCILIAQFPYGNHTINLEIAMRGNEAALSVLNLENFPSEWAGIQNNLGLAYREKIRGEKEKNLEEAIKYFQKSLKVHTLEDFPFEWAGVQNNLGAVYALRIRGKEEENLEKAISYYKEALKVYNLEAFPFNWAGIQNNLGSAYIRLIKEGEEKNLEEAIKYFQESLKVYTLEAFPSEWAQTQKKLGAVYYLLNIGEKKENLEKAIEYYQESLKVYTLEDFPSEWAEIKHFLGTTYRNRIQGKKADNIEEVIKCFRESLKVYTLEAFPSEWAGIQDILGAVYRQRLIGEKAENMETAISYYQESLKVYTPKAFPSEWAEIQNKLGIAYRNRIQGERADNLEEAIKFYRESLKVYTHKAFPFEWAQSQNNLGNVYACRIKGKTTDNLEEAIKYYQESLKVRTYEDFPEEWADTQNNLGNAYYQKFIGENEENAENIEKAISYFQEALKVRTSEDFPEKWAETVNNLGNVYSRRLIGEKAKNIETAISYYQESLEYYKLSPPSYNWALIQNNLGSAYRFRGIGKKEENVEEAISCYQKSLKFCTPEKFPIDCLTFARNLGMLALEERRWELAIEAYKKGIQALEISYNWAMTLYSKQEVIEASIDVYHGIVEAYINIKQSSLALEYVERSKTRNLVELINTRNFTPKGDFSSDVITELNRLRDELRTEQIFLANQERIYDSLSNSGTSSQLSRPDRTRIKQLQQQLEELILRYISPIDPTFSLTQKFENFSFRDIQSLIDEHTAIIEWYITKEKIFTFLVTHHHPKPQVWQFSTDKVTILEDWVIEYLQNYYTNKQKWRNDLESNLLKLAQILHLDGILSLILKECDHLILIPHLFLHFLPLHALPTSEQLDSISGGQSKTLQDLFPRGVKYAPSCQLLKVAQSQHRKNFQNFFAIQNPTEDLIYTDLEVETIRSFFPEVDVLVRQAASETALKINQNLLLANCVHFSCHGTFNFASPLESALILSKNQNSTEYSYLTLIEIFELSLQKCCLVTLSACETGLTEFNLRSDEYIGLPSGFMFAGSPSIVSSLWTVSDLSTAFLMIKFYENLPQSLQAGEVAISLKKAQKWLRNLTCQEFEKELTKPQYQKAIAQLQQKFSSADFFELEDAIQVERERLKKFDPNYKPFANPFYWAAFIAIGV